MLSPLKLLKTLELEGEMATRDIGIWIPGGKQCTVLTRNSHSHPLTFQFHKPQKMAIRTLWHLRSNNIPLSYPLWVVICILVRIGRMYYERIHSYLSIWAIWVNLSKTASKTFSDTNFLRYRIQYVFNTLPGDHICNVAEDIYAWMTIWVMRSSLLTPISIGLPVRSSLTSGSI